MKDLSGSLRFGRMCRKHGVMDVMGGCPVDLCRTLRGIVLVFQPPAVHIIPTVLHMKEIMVSTII